MSGTGNWAPPSSSASASAWVRILGQSRTAARTSSSTRVRSSHSRSRSASARIRSTSMRIQLSTTSPGAASSGSTPTRTSSRSPDGRRRTTTSGWTSRFRSMSRDDSALVTESTRNGMSSVTISSDVPPATLVPGRSFSSPGTRCRASSRCDRVASTSWATWQPASSSSGTRRQYRATSPGSASWAAATATASATRCSASGTYCSSSSSSTVFDGSPEGGQDGHFL